MTPLYGRGFGESSPLVFLLRITTATTIIAAAPTMPIMRNGCIFGMFWEGVVRIVRYAVNVGSCSILYPL